MELLKRKLLQSQKMETLGTLSGGIAHDFNNILMAIIGFSEILQHRIPAESVLQKDVAQVIKAGNRAKELVQQILAFSRQAEQENKPVQVQFILKEVLQFLRSSVPSTIKFKTEIDCDCGPILADSIQIHQVVMNLCTNAYHAMRENGGVLGVRLSEVELAASDFELDLDLKPGTYVMLEISDTGSGMEKSTVERIFDPYFSTKGQGEGTGLGLTVVHGIVKRLHGHITVQSELGVGTSFQLYFPKIEAYFQNDEEILDKHLPRGCERILLVDDEKQLVDLGKNVLESLGYQVTALSNPVETLQIFQEKYWEFDLVITDMTMPDMTGDELAKKLIDCREDIPIILCTGFSEIINEEKAKSLGIRCYVMKPIVQREFAQLIRDVLDS